MSEHTNLQTLFHKYKPLITNHLKNFYQGKRAGAKKDDLFYLDLLDRLETFSINGKMLRGGLVLLSYEMNGGVIDEKSLNAAAAMELFHSVLLIHDDVMDNDLLRRGNETIYAQYKKELPTSTQYYGQSMAICVGDFAYFLAVELLNDSSDNFEVQKKVIKKTLQEFQYVGTAQMMDVHFAQPHQLPTLDQSYYIYSHKTGRYGFTLPLYIGELLAKKITDFHFQLEEFSEKLGVIFQIKDDELGFLGDEETIGKPVGSDIRENKKTYLYLLLYESASPEEKKYLDSCYGNPKLTEADVQAIKKMAEEKGVLKEIQTKIDQLHRDITTSLQNSSVSQEYKVILTELVEYNLQRKK